MDISPGCLIKLSMLIKNNNNTIYIYKSPSYALTRAT